MLSPLEMSALSNRYRDLLERIEKQRPPASPPVTLVAVSKKQSVDAIECLYQLGQRDFGENYVQELLFKHTELRHRGCTEIRWHFIGHLQTNKAKTLLPAIHTMHTLDSEKLAATLESQWTALTGMGIRSGKLPVFIEVNLDREPSKSGILPEQVVEFSKKVAAISAFHLAGLMCIPSPNQDPRARFKALRDLERRCRPESGGNLSMGMSSDFGIAVEEGATHVRVGSMLFGERH